MQHLIYLISLSFCLSSAGSSWHTHYPSARSLAKETNKPILMVFSGSDWCRPCIMMEKEIFETESFMQYADSNMVLLKVDFPRRKKNLLTESQQTHNDALAAKYNPQGSFPKVVLLSQHGEVVAQTDYLAGGVNSLIQFLDPHLEELKTH